MAIIKNTNSFVFFVYLKLKLPSEDGLSALLCLFPQLVSGQCNKSFFGLKKKKRTQTTTNVCKVVGKKASSHTVGDNVS
jgi:hypothetical protein